MNEKRKHTLIISVGLILGYFSLPLAVGWVFGWFGVALLQTMRQRFYTRLFLETNFSKRGYAWHALVVLFVIASSLFIGFMWPHVMNPFGVFAAYLGERLWVLVTQSKEA